MQRNGGKQQSGKEKDYRFLQENWRYQGNISCKDGTIKDSNCRDLPEAEEIKKRWKNTIWKNYTEKVLRIQITMITHLQQPHILECKVKWALGSITLNKANGADGIPAQLFKILKDDVKVLHSICQQIWKISSGERTEKIQFSFQSQRRAM